MFYLNLQEEKEKRLEEMFESDIDNAFENRYVPKEEIPEEGAVALAGKKTQETLTATDLIIDALDIAEVELKRIVENEVFLFNIFSIVVHFGVTNVSICTFVSVLWRAIFFCGNFKHCWKFSTICNLYQM